MAARLDVVYILGRQDTYEELRYSLRSLANLPHRRVWVAGARPPEWCQGVDWISVHQKPGHVQRMENQRRNLMVAAEHPKVSQRFVLMNDDFHFLEALDEVPPTPVRGRISDVVSNPHPSAGPYQKLSEAFRSIGVSTWYYAEHVPMVMDRRISRWMREWWHVAQFPIPTLYGNLADAPHVDGPDHVIGPGWEDRWSVSTVGEIPDELRERFPDPSEYER